mmetsp:Transcript_914/g.2373  ORF Transcript_914/g.2373 Transcript_914/m.2373 type:complete len:250 (-) Transcript_914:242-991(-)
MNVFISALLAFTAAAAAGYALQALVAHGTPSPFPPPTGSLCALPLCMLDAALLWRSNPTWQDGSWWATLRGPFLGQLAPLAVCAFTISPALLSAWLLSMLPQCSPLPCLLTLLVGAASGASLLFWTSRLPLLPAANATPESARRGVRLALACLLQALYFAAAVFVTAPSGECAALASSLYDLRAVGEQLHAEMVAQTVQSMLSPSALVLQVICAVLAIHIVIDEPTGADGKEENTPPEGHRRLLWGPMD